MPPAFQTQESRLGGINFNAANILLVAGMSVAFPVGVGIALGCGVLVNCLGQPLGNLGLLFLGVGLVTVAILLNAYAYRRAAAQAQIVSRGLVLAVVAGLLMGFFYKYVATSMFPDFSVPEADKLSPYSAVFYFAVGSIFKSRSLLLARFI